MTVGGPSENPYSAQSQDNELANMQLPGSKAPSGTPNFKDVASGKTQDTSGETTTGSTQTSSTETSSTTDSSKLTPAQYHSLYHKFMEAVMLHIAEEICQQLQQSMQQIKKTYQQAQENQ